MSTQQKSPTGLKSVLTTGQLSMMGLGGAIGAGLFVGSGAAINIAGPAVLVSYILAGLLVVLLMTMLAEMVAADPSSGAFSTFAHKALGPTAGATIGWMYWVQLVVVIAAEATGAAAVLAPWVPQVPQWVWVLVFMISLTAVNLVGVAFFGNFEFWFAALKVGAIIVFLAVGAAIIFGLVPDVPAAGFTNLTAHGGFTPNGLAGVAAAVLIVLFAFGGTEVVAIAAAESTDPAHNIKRAIKSVMIRISIFYIGSILVIVAVLPWNSPDVLAGPFAGVLGAINVPGVDLLMSLIVAIALLSAMNANIYACSRMIFSLSRRGLAPRQLTRIGRRGVPFLAVAASVAFGFVTVALNYLAPDLVLPLMLNNVGSTLLVIWSSIAVSQIVLRRRAERDNPESLKLRMWAFPYLSGLVLVMLSAIMALAMTDATARTQLLATGGLTLTIAVLCKLALSRGRTQNPEPATTNLHDADQEQPHRPHAAVSAAQPDARQHTE